jgi:KaiC/GvpD/RAD55 family RecA-like ATPase
MTTASSRPSDNLPPITFDPDFATTSELASYYRDCGWQVVPAWMPGEPKEGSWKRPYLKHWRSYQVELVPLAVFRSFYDPVKGQYSGRQNLGLITGRVSRTYVIDLDIQKDPRARAWWLALMEVHNNGIEIETVEQVTGGGGVQLFFRAPVGVPIPTCKTPIGVDIRGEGGFAMLPSSRHESGQDYAWKPGRAPWECEIAVSPEWLIAELKKLAQSHAGATAGPSGGNGQAAAGAHQLDAFANVRDGREDVMFRAVWHAVLEWQRENPILPPETDWLPRARAAYEAYEAKVTVQDRTSGLPKREQLDAEDRGPKEWWKKWRAAMAQWDTEEFRAEAAKPPPAADPPDDDFGSADPPPPPAAAPMAATPIKLVSPFPIDGARIPRRDWQVPGLLLRRAVTLIVAPPGIGKSLLTIQVSIMAAVGGTWGTWGARKPEKVLIINAEDDYSEMQRRLWAAATDMGVDQGALADRVLLAEQPDSIVIARFDARSRSVIRTPLLEDIVATIKAHGITLVVVDPFAETIDLDENSNSQIKWAGMLWREVARRTGCAVLIVHHTRKGSNAMAGDADAARGGGAMIGIARVVSTLFDMTEEEATALGIPVEQRRDYVRFDDAKANYSRPVLEARWFIKKTIVLPNAGAMVPGDEVGVLVPWAVPGPLAGISMHAINLALDAIDRGVLDEQGKPNGQYYAAVITSASKERWAGRVLMRQLGCAEGAAKALIKTWLQEDVLEVFDYVDPVLRKPRKGVRSVLNNRPGKASKFT